MVRGIFISYSLLKKQERRVEGKLEAFKQRGMQRIIIDLRDNAGGLLSGAIEVASLFVPENESIVTVKGRGQGQKRVFTCKKDGPYVEMPIAILLNEGSAQCFRDSCRSPVKSRESYTCW